MTEPAIDIGQTWRLRRPSPNRVSSESIQVVGLEYETHKRVQEGKLAYQDYLPSTIKRVIVAYWYPWEGLSKERRVRMRPDSLRRSYDLVHAQSTFVIPQ